jgi:hypothetical protein
MKFAAWAVFVPIWVVLVYCPVSFWIYGGAFGKASPDGSASGSLDFAGGTSSTSTPASPPCAVMVLGKRKGWPKEGHPPHSMPLVMIGVGILWLGWFGFNAGSAFAASGTLHPGVPQHVPGRRGGHRLEPSSSGSRTGTSPASCGVGHRGRPGRHHPGRLRGRDVARVDRRGRRRHLLSPST